MSGLVLFFGKKKNFSFLRHHEITANIRKLQHLSETMFNKLITFYLKDSLEFQYYKKIFKRNSDQD